MNVQNVSVLRAKKLHRSVLENIQDVFYRSDCKGDLIMASPSWASLLGYATVDECLGKNIAEIFYYEPHRRADLVDEIMKNGAVSDYEVVLKRRDGYAAPCFHQQSPDLR
ncbi:MAG: PAS domain S-box protein [Bacillus subtilis]|nr:PAS domain S-box protein [Bacillus subtilis]